jgi:hypothetical protein
VDEPPALVQAFIAWHLSLGAAHIFLYCDRPDDPVQALVAGVPNVTIVPCDEAHWRRVGKSRPKRHQVRQVRNARDAYARAQTAWLLHIDADEFVWVNGVVQDRLAQVSPQADCLILPVAERMHLPAAPGQSVLEGAFRRPLRKSAKKGLRLFGPDYDLTYRGLTGHAQGKAFVRTNRALNMSIHRPRPLASEEELAIARSPADAMELLHFDGLTPTYWTYKLARMAHALAKRDGMPPSPHRRRQADALLAAGGDGAAIYARLKGVDPALQAVLQRHDLWLAPGFDPTAALRTYFPDQVVDLRPEVIDRWLQQEKASTLAFMRPPSSG